MEKKKILFAASECLPFAKTGGLADVVGSLPVELAKNGNEVAVVLPLYQTVIDNFFNELERIGQVRVQSGWLIYQPATYYRCVKNGVTYYFIEHQGYFERPGLYGYRDDGERFAFFQRALLDMLGFLDWWPDVINSNDWQTGMVPLLCHACFGDNYHYQQIKHVYTIHNLAFQGNFGVEMLPSCLGLDYYYFDNGSIKFDTGISFMKAGIVYADKITTVSPTYSQEILTQLGGERMDAILRYRREDLWGITNGIDVEVWNPETDPLIPVNYSAKAWKRAKAHNKAELQKELGLEEDKNKCLIGVVSRLSNQKGVYLILDRIEKILEADVQLVVLGTGEHEAEQGFRWMEDNHKGQAVYYQGYNETLAHRIYAGCDLFLMPSLFEPCGISQMIAMHYGTLPIVRETGGLKDTVTPFNQYTGEGNGFSFYAANADDMVYTINYALKQYKENKEGWQYLVESAMNTDVSWKKSAGLYEKLYNELS